MRMLPDGLQLATALPTPYLGGQQEGHHAGVAGEVDEQLEGLQPHGVVGRLHQEAQVVQAAAEGLVRLVAQRQVGEAQQRHRLQVAAPVPGHRRRQQQRDARLQWSMRFPLLETPDLCRKFSRVLVSG